MAQKLLAGRSLMKLTPELQEPVPDPEKQVVAGGWEVTSSRPQQKSIRGKEFDSKVQRICVAN